MIKFEMKIKLNTRTIVGVVICGIGLYCVASHADPGYWPILAMGIISMVGGQIGSVTIPANLGGGGRDTGDERIDKRAKGRNK